MADMHFTGEHPDAERSSHPSTAQVWDSLTKPALKELDRRNRSAEPRRHYPLPSPVGYRPLTRHRRPLTRQLLAEWRRDIRSENTPASDFLRACSAAALSDIQAFARHGGPDLLDLRGYPFTFVYRSRETMISPHDTQERGRKRRASELESSLYIPHTSSKRSRSTGAYDPGFEQRMIDDNIYPAGYRYPNGQKPSKPQNWAEIQQMLTERRLSLVSYPEERYDEFVEADEGVTSENRATVKVIPMIQGAIRAHFVNGDTLLNNLADIIRGPCHKAKPDVYYGARPEQLHRDIRDQLRAFVVPSTKDTRPLAPNFFIEAKSPSGPALVNLKQACFAGALGARGMHSLQTYGEQTPRYDNNAYTLSATYHSGTLKIYSHHPTRPHNPGSQPEYHMHQLYAWALTASKESLIQGITAFRNAESWTEAQRNAAIDHANAVANRTKAGKAAANPFPRAYTRALNLDFSENDE